MNMDSLGVMDLDLSISPDVYGLWAFAQMLPGSTPCELRLMLPDAKLGIDGLVSSDGLRPVTGEAGGPPFRIEGVVRLMSAD